LSRYVAIKQTYTTELQTNTTAKERYTSPAVAGRGRKKVILSFHFLSRPSRQRERLSASILSICSSFCLFVCLSLSVAKIQKTRFSQKLSNLELLCLLTTYPRKSYMGFSKNHYWTLKSKMTKIRHLENRHDVIFFCRGGPIWIKFRRLVQNDVSTAVI